MASGVTTSNRVFHMWITASAHGLHAHFSNKLRRSGGIFVFYVITGFMLLFLFMEGDLKNSREGYVGQDSGRRIWLRGFLGK